MVGAGPAAFYATEKLLKSELVSVDMFERLPAPYGLVRYGVAPDHLKIKNVTRAFDKTASHPDFRFFGNVRIGVDLSLEDLRQHYSMVLFGTGAQTDRRLGIPGEDLPGSHPATEFVAWYNGHPDFVSCEFDLSAKNVAVIGVGNVAVDVARILCRTHAELNETDMAQYAIDSLIQSSTTNVYMLGRRGPAQAAFTNPEVKELGELDGADVVVRREDVALSDVEKEFLEASDDKTVARKMEILNEFSALPEGHKPRKLHIRFRVSPVEIVAGDDGRVSGIKVVYNRMVLEGGRIRPIPTDKTELIPVELVFRSVGYRGVRIEGVPFDDKQGIIPNDAGRVVDEDGERVAGMYVTGWIKRGPSGVIGTNKPDGAETAASMLEDLQNVQAPPGDAGTIFELLESRNVRAISYSDWQQLDKLEIENGRACGRPRQKFLTARDMILAVRSDARK